MKEARILVLMTVLYLVVTALFLFRGNESTAWNVTYYSNEKLFASLGFILLALHSRIRILALLSLYCAAVSVFMLGHYIWCYAFGYNSVYTVATFLIYSLVTLLLLSRKLQ